jgi:predicted Zn-ribbon and HTH transcriptional regulator
MKCPKCKSDNIKGFARISDYATIDLRTNDIIHEFRDMEVDYNSMDEFHCNDCDYEWISEYEWEL